MPFDQRTDFLDRAALAEKQPDLARLTTLQSQIDLQCGARVEAGADLIGQRRLSERTRPRELAVPSEKLESVAGDRSRRLAAPDERKVIGTFVAKPIGREKGSACIIAIRHDVPLVALAGRTEE